MTMLQIAGLGLAAIWLYVTLLWVVSLLLKDASIIDIFWGPGFILLAWWYAWLGASTGPRRWLLLALVTIWGLRLGLHILMRNVGKPEDYRYAAWREEHGSRWWWRSYVEVFLLQGGLIWLIGWPLLVALTRTQGGALTALDWLGAALWAIGFFFEAVGDWQLARFKADPSNKGKLLTSGLWRYTRHPNYFGDATQWWGFWLIAAAAGGWWTAFSPIVMTWLLVRVSGVAMLEETLKETKPGYEAYVRRTNAFVPWFPRAEDTASGG